MDQFLSHTYFSRYPGHFGGIKFILTCKGDKVENVKTELGFLHRGIEKIIEDGKFTEALIYLDRIISVGVPFSEEAFVLATAKLIGITPPKRAQTIRVIICELARIAGNLSTVARMAFDTGVVLIWALVMSVREKIMNIFYEISGFRVFMRYFSIAGVAKDVTNETLDHIFTLTADLTNSIDEIEALLTHNFVFKSRTEGVGVITSNQALEFGLSGSALRATGIDYDLRKKRPYEIYDELDFDVPVRSNGDAYDRYILKILEARESIKIINQCLENFPKGDFILRDYRFTPPPIDSLAYGNIIYHINYYLKGIEVPAGSYYQAVESHIGEFGIHLFSDGKRKPSRSRIRSACFSRLQILSSIVKKIDELPIVVSSLDIFACEADR